MTKDVCCLGLKKKKVNIGDLSEFKQSFVPKAIFTLVARIIIRKYFFQENGGLDYKVTG